MSSEFERFLREARQTLPEPDDAATRRGRERALLAMVPRRRRFRPVAFVVALILAIGLGVGIGTFVVPSGTAADSPVGFGFLPERDWYVLQSGVAATPERPAVAFASNVPLSPDDGRSIVPYSTLQRLPPEGIVIVANFTGRTEYQVFPSNASFPPQKLPLRIRDATPYIQFGGQVRPEQPLGQFQLRAEIDGYTVDLHFYFGTPQPTSGQMKAAQRQLDRLVVSSGRSPREARSRDIESSLARPSAGSAGLIDRTFVCSTASHGGVYEVEARAHAGYRVNARWARLPYAVVATGGAGGALSGNQSASPNSLAWITAGNPVADTTVDSEYETFPVRRSGTLGIRRGQCKAMQTRVSLSKAGLRGGATTALGEELDCVSPRRVLLRVRARLQLKGDLKQRNLFLATSVPILDAKLTVRTLAGKPLVYAEVFQSGRTPLFTAGSCVRD